MEKQAKPRKKSRIILILLFIALNIVVISVTAVREFSQKPAEKLTIRFGASNWLFLMAGIGCMLVTLAIETAKYLIMMRSLNEKVSPKAAFETAALGKYYDNITPFGSGGQPFQIYSMHKFGYSGGISAAMPLTSFFTMQSGFVILAVLIFIFGRKVATGSLMLIPAIIGAIFYMAIPALILLFTIAQGPATGLLRGLIRLGAKLHIVKDPEETGRSLLQSLRDYRSSVLMMSRRKWLIPLLLGLSFLYQLAMSSIPFFVLLAFNGSAPYFETLAMTVLVYCVSTIVPTPGNSGAMEGSFYIIFSALDPTGLFWAMLVWRFICYYAFIVIGILIYAFHAAAGRKAENKGWKQEDYPDGGGGDTHES